jgi:hypothetical protein
MWRRDANWLRALEAGQFDRILSGREEEERWERFALRTANTPGHQRVVLRVPWQNRDGSRWFMWASYRLEDGDLAVDRARLVLDAIFVPDPDDDDPLACPEELEDEAIFEAEG